MKTFGIESNELTSVEQPPFLRCEVYLRWVCFKDTFMLKIMMNVPNLVHFPLANFSLVQLTFEFLAPGVDKNCFLNAKLRPDCLVSAVNNFYSQMSKTENLKHVIHVCLVA